MHLTAGSFADALSSRLINSRSETESAVASGKSSEEGAGFGHRSVQRANRATTGVDFLSDFSSSARAGRTTNADAKTAKTNIRRNMRIPHEFGQESVGGDRARRPPHRSIPKSAYLCFARWVAEFG